MVLRIGRLAGLLAVLVVVLALFGWDRVQRVSLPRTTTLGDTAYVVAAPTRSGVEEVTLDRLPGPVADAAGRLTWFDEILEHQAEGLETDLGVDLHVVTLADPDTRIADLADRVFQERRISRESRTGGILILLNAARSEARIEVSYELEGVLPDAELDALAEHQLAPYASYRFSGMAIMDVISMLRSRLYLEALRGELDLAPDYRARSAYLDAARYLSGGGGAQTEIPRGASDRELKVRVPEARRARYAPASDPHESVEAYVRVLSEWVGDPTLELFTPGSRLMRAGYPFAPLEAMERAAALRSGRPWQVVTEGDRTVVLASPESALKFAVPLHRIDGTWRVDLVETWKNLQTGRERQPVVANANTPYYFGFQKLGTAGPWDMAAWDVGGRALEDVVTAFRARAAAPRAPLESFLLAELLWRNCFLAVEALEAYERAATQAPHAPLFLATLGDRARYVGLHRLAIEAYSRLGDEALLELARAQARVGDLEGALASVERALERDPLDLAALRTQASIWEQRGDRTRAEKAEALVQALASDPERSSVPLDISFDPPRPRFVADSPSQQGDRNIFDYSQFTLRIANPTAAPVELRSVQVWSRGTGRPSGLGDVKGQLAYPGRPLVLGPGEVALLDRTWGFSVDTQHQQVSYVVDVCWHAAVTSHVRCRIARVDAMPR